MKGEGRGGGGGGAQVRGGCDAQRLSVVRHPIISCGSEREGWMRE